MSGHSKWATIHRAKEIKDQARGKLFSKYARIITIAARSGGGPNPDSNFKLKDAIDRARSINMPKENIERAINKATEAGDLFEVTYEGFAPGNVAVMIEAATDNKNRTVAEIKHIFDKGGGNLGSPGSVSYNFEQKGQISVEKTGDMDSQMLQLIDLGASDIEDDKTTLEVFVDPTKTNEVKNSFEQAGFKVNSFDVIMRPKMLVKVEDVNDARKVVELLEILEDHDDVQKVFANVDIPESVMQQIS